MIGLFVGMALGLSPDGFGNVLGGLLDVRVNLSRNFVNSNHWDSILNFICSKKTWLMYINLPTSNIACNRASLECFF